MKVDLSGKVALVNGASRGIGEAIARGLADCGATVVCSSHSPAITSRRLSGAGNSRFSCPGMVHAVRPNTITMVAVRPSRCKFPVCCKPGGRAAVRL